MPSKARIELLKDISSIFGSVFLPIAVFAVGQAYTNNQARAAEDRAYFDRMAVVLQSLASEKAGERLEALNVLTFYAGKCQFANVLLPAVAERAEDDNPEVVKQAMLIGRTALGKCQKDVHDLASLNPTTGAWLEEVSFRYPETVVNFDDIAATVLIRIGSEAERAKAQDFKSKLEEGYGVLIQKGAQPAAKMADVLYFHPEDKLEALDIIDKLGPDVLRGQVELLAGVKAPRRHYELRVPR